MASAVTIGGAEDYGLVRITTEKREMLNYAEIKKCGDKTSTSNKFYLIELQVGSGPYPYRVYCEYGRLGKPPTKKARYHLHYSSAATEYTRLLKEKQRKGYEIISTNENDLSSHVNHSSSSPKFLKRKMESIDVSTVKDKVLRLTGKIYQEATGLITRTIKTPLGSLKSSQIIKGASVLKEIEDLLDGKASNSRLEMATNEFYSIIPTIFGTALIDYDTLLINSYTKLNEQKNLLGVMNSVLKVKDNLNGTLEEKYKALGTLMSTLKKNTKEYKEIKTLIKGSHGYNHHFEIDVLDIYKVDNSANEPEFNPINVSTMELFHGTRNANILNILQGGLKIKPGSAVHTGSMFGQGIYFASSSSKSANYCRGFGNAQQVFKENYLFVCEVATGKIKDYTSAQPYLTKSPSSYNSVKGKKGSSLLHDEYIVYNENQVRIRYIVEFKFK